MCPKCRSQSLKVRQLKGIERLIVLMCGKRKYRCRDCDTRFRAPDRRRAPRKLNPNTVLESAEARCEMAYAPAAPRLKNREITENVSTHHAAPVAAVEAHIDLQVARTELLNYRLAHNQAELNNV